MSLQEILSYPHYTKQGFEQLAARHAVISMWDGALGMGEEGGSYLVALEKPREI